MEPALQLEKKIFQSWRRNTFHSESDIYIQNAEAQLKRRGKSATWMKIKKKLDHASVLFLADHLLSSRTQDLLREALPKKRGPKEQTVLITDRFSPAFAKKLSLRGVRNLSQKDWEKGLGISSFLELKKGIPRLFSEFERRRYRILGLRRKGDLFQADEGAAESIRKELRLGNRVVFWTGLLRITPSHLPAEVSSFCEEWAAFSADGGMSRFYQDRFSPMVSFGDRLFLDQSLSPLERMEAERLFNDELQEHVDSEFIRKSFLNSWAKIGRSMGLIRKEPSLKVFHPFSKRSLEKLVSAPWTKEEWKFILERLRRGESATFPNSRSVLVSTLDPGEIAEEAAHFRHLLGWKFPRVKEFMMIEEMFGFFGSLLCHAKRVPPTKLVMSSEWEELHQAGYAYGQALFDLWTRKPSSRGRIRQFWRARPKDRAEVVLLFQEVLSLLSH